MKLHRWDNDSVTGTWFLFLENRPSGFFISRHFYPSTVETLSEDSSTLNFYSQLKVGRFQLLLRAMNCALGMFDYPFSDDNDHRRSTWLPRPSGCPQGWLKQVARCSPKLSPSTRLRFSQLNRLRFSPVAFGSPRLHGEKSPRLFLWQMTAVRMRLRKKHERIENDGPNFQFRGFHLMIMSFTHSVKFTPRWC